VPRIAITLLAVAFAAVVRPARADAPPSLPPVVFDGFGLGDLSAAASVGRALRAAEATATASAAPLDVVVRGPGGGVTGPLPLAAEVRGRIEGIAVAAGLQGDATALVERQPQWIGRIGVGSTRPDGAESLEFRTRLESRAQTDRLGVEIGPRIERRLPRGARFFIDGAATAEAVRGEQAGTWAMPGTSTADTAAAVGVSARTGIVR
jgi:hypothetical protein